jgi:O-antigen ligase
MALMLACVIGLIPLLIAPRLSFYFDVTPKTALLLLASAAATLVWAVAEGAPGLPRHSPSARLFVLTLYGTAASLLVSTLASFNRRLSLGGSDWRCWGLPAQLAVLVLAYLVAVCCAGNRGRMRLLLRAITTSGLVAAIYGMVQYFGWDPFQPAGGYHMGEGIWTIVRPPSTLGHADYFANWLLGAVFCAVALQRMESARSGTWLARVSMAAGVMGIVLSGTRAAMIGLLAGGLLLALRHGLRLTRRVLAAGSLVLVAAAAFYWSPAGTLLRARVHWSLEEPAGGARLLLWRDSLRMAESRLPLGYGPETFLSAFALHQSTDLSRAYPDFYHESPHNIFLDALVAQGIPGLVLLLLLLAIGLAGAWQLRREPAAAALGAGLAAMILSQQFACFMLPTALAVYLAVAMLVSLTCVSPAKPRPDRRRWPLLAGALPLAAVFAFIGFHLILSDSALAAVRGDLEAGKLADATNHYAMYDRWRLPGASADLWYSRRLAQLAQTRAEQAVRVQAFQQGLIAAQRAPSSVEDPFNAYYNLAAFYASLNDFARTEQSLREAIARAPNWFKPHWMLAQVLDAAHRLDTAEYEASIALTLDAKHSAVKGTFEHIHAEVQAARQSHP